MVHSLARVSRQPKSSLLCALVFLTDGPPTPPHPGALGRLRCLVRVLCRTAVVAHAITGIQRINHFQKSGIITCKDSLLRGLGQLRAAYGQCYAIFPESYILPTEYTKFVRDYSKQEVKKIWICKPSDSSRGRGIFMIRDLSELTYDQQYIVQSYIDRPLCVGGYKQDLRM